MTVFQGDHNLHDRQAGEEIGVFLQALSKRNILGVNDLDETKK